MAAIGARGMPSPSIGSDCHSHCHILLLRLLLPRRLAQQRRGRQQAQLLKGRGQLQHAAEDGGGAQPGGQRAQASAVHPHGSCMGQGRVKVSCCTHEWAPHRAPHRVSHGPRRSLA